MFLFFTNKLKVNPLFARMTFIVQIQKEKEAPKFHNALLLGNSYRQLRENPFYKRKNSKIRLFWKWIYYCLHFQNTNCFNRSKYIKFITIFKYRNKWIIFIILTYLKHSIKLETTKKVKLRLRFIWITDKCHSSSFWCNGGCVVVDSNITVCKLVCDWWRFHLSGFDWVIIPIDTKAESFSINWISLEEQEVDLQCAITFDSW